MKDSLHNSASHPPETLIAAYAIGRCSPTEQAEIDEHCFTCEGCRTRLSILLRLCAVDGNEEEKKELERLFPLGMETIAQARHPESSYSGQSVSKDRSSSSYSHSTTQSGRGRVLNPLAKLASQRKFQVVVSIILLAVAGGAYYWFNWIQSPLQNSLNAMRRSYRLSRPLEARMTGNFDYQPYERTRGESAGPDLDRDQINYALLELTKAVASSPTPEERHALGRLYMLIGKFDEAESQMKEALKGLPQNARLHTDLATLYYERSKHEDPEVMLPQAVEHYSAALEIEPQLAEAWFNIALCHERMGLIIRAREDWNKYLEIDSTSDWAQEARERLKKLNSKASQQSDRDKNLVAMLQAAIESKDEKALREIITSDFVAVKNYSTGQFFDEYLNADLNGNEKLAESHLSALQRIGQISAEIKGDNFISDSAGLAARASPEVKSGMRNVRLMLRQADSEFERSSHDIAFKLYQSAYQTAERVGDECHTEIAASSLVRYYNSRAKTEKLITLGNQLIPQTERRRHRQIQSQIHTALANAYLASQQSALALENALRASEIARELGDTDTEMSALRLAGTAYTRSGSYDRALDKLFEILPILRDRPFNPIRSFQAYHSIWETLFNIGNYRVALDYQLEALMIAQLLNNHPAIAGTAGRVGLNLWKLGRYSEAEKNLNEAISRCNSIKDQTTRQLLQVDLYTMLGDVSLSLGKSDDAVANYKRAIETVKGSRNRVYLTVSHQGLASAYLAQKKIAEAESELRKSISLIERDRQQIKDISGRSAFLARSQNVFDAMVDLQFNEKRDYATAFDYAEKAKGRHLLDALGNRASTKESDGRIVLSVSNSTRPLKLKDVQRQMPTGTQILSYAITEKNLLIWHVSKSDVFAISVELTAARLKELVSGYITNLRARRDLETLNQQSAELYQYLISPVASKLDVSQQLCLIPDGILSQLPFPALYSSQTKRFLIEDFSMTYNPSASVFVRESSLAKTKQKSSPESFIGISNPRFNNRRFPGLPALPSSEEEISNAHPLYQQSLVFNQQNATESEVALRIGNHHIVHIASHTLIDAQSPLLSSIILAEEKSNAPKDRRLSRHSLDGTLQAEEIYQMSLPRTRLVILSSCRSAIGDFTRGEALGALAQAFFVAGAPSVIASLWDVDDESSSEVMYSFHYHHRVKQMGFGEALRQAQKAQIYSSDAKKRHPYYWAAFLIAGDGLSNPGITS